LGWNGFRIISLPILLFLFTVPLPHGVFLSLSGELQLLSSKVGVYLIETLGISVYQEGNIIELGTYKLQVEEACSGLRYLYPLMSLSFVTAYFLKTSYWIRLFVFLSSIPLAIIMNGVRLGLTGLLVEYKGADIAEGFLHYFEGWLIFLFSITILFCEVWLFARIFYQKSLRDVLMIELPTTSERCAYNSNIFRSKPFTVVVFVLAISAIFRLCLSMPDLQEKIYPETPPYKMDFSSFPLELGEWQGIRGELKKWEIEMLKHTEYIIADYRNNANEVVNLYAGFWASKQRGGPHRPEICLTGGGWQILEVSKIGIKGVSFTEKPINVNRIRLEKGGDIKLVYYWYQLENKHFQSNIRLWWHRNWERLIKGHQQKNLTMIRLMTPVGFSHNSASADIRLSMFAKELFRAFNNNIFIHCSRAEIKSTNLPNNYK
jgi:exosortase D (VPLPA-CTERM-specific)